MKEQNFYCQKVSIKLAGWNIITWTCSLHVGKKAVPELDSKAYRWIHALYSILVCPWKLDVCPDVRERADQISMAEAKAVLQEVTTTCNLCQNWYDIKTEHNMD